LTRSQVHHIIYVFLLFALAAAIPVSNFAMSAAGIFLAVNWVLEGQWREKWNRLRERKVALILASFFFIFLLGLIHTDNWHDGLDNVLSKLPMLYAPLILASSAPLSGKEQRFVVGGFVLSTFVGTCIAFTFAFAHPSADFRQSSMFISHIRFGFSVILSILFACFFAFKYKKTPLWQRLVACGFVLWFVAYIFVVQTVTAMLLLVLLALVYTFYLFWVEKEFRFRKTLLTAAILTVTAFAGYVSYITWSYFHYDYDTQLELYTKSGNTYTHDLNSIIENGSPIEIYVFEPELVEAWGQRSKMPYDSVRATLVRYLNSKHLRKDLEGVNALNDKDIDNIEHYIANVGYTQFIGVKRALYPTFFSISLYYSNGQVANSSLLQRFALWHAGAAVVAEHWATGVGIGDHKEALNEKLQVSSPDIPLNMGAHNQFITLWIMGGFILPLAFLVILFLPFFMRTKPSDVLYILFFIIVFLSCFAEDTIETQAGMTFYTFFNAFFLFCFDRQDFTDEKLTIKI